MATQTATAKVERDAKLRWVPLAMMRVSSLAQRELKPAWVDHIVAHLDLEQIGTPTVNLRDGHYYIIDGQHRVEALRAYGFADDKIQCWTYEGLSEEDEAERFLKLNNQLVVDAFSRFTVGVQANRDVEVAIDKLVREEGLKVARQQGDGAIQAVGTLRKIYNRAGSQVLRRTLQVIYKAYEDPGLEAGVLDGIAHVIARYDRLDDARLIDRLGNARLGVGGLKQAAAVIHNQTGKPVAHCLAAAVVDRYNRGLKGTGRLPSWWKADDES